MSRRTPAEHPAWPRLTADQRKAVNEVWDETVIPALEEADRLKRAADDLRLEAQDNRYAAEDAIAAAAFAVDEPRIRADERQKAVRRIVDYLDSGEFRGAHLANRFAAVIAHKFGDEGGSDGEPSCDCMTEPDPLDPGGPERVLTHSLTCPLAPDNDTEGPT